MVKINRRWVIAGLALCLVGGAAGVWALLHPAAFWLKPWRPQAQAFDSRIIFGPYPTEADFQSLQNKGVTTIVSLLDSDLPYEAVLLGQEKALAAKYGMKVLNFPMASILGQSFGKDYVAMSQAAAKAVLEDPGIVYLHCYLGLHRAENVRKLLAAGHATVRHEGAVASERSPDTLALDRANFAFLDRNYELALKELEAIKELAPEARLLRAWSHYRLNQIALARADFAEVVKARPESADANNGLGYCALREGNLPAAAQAFERVLKSRADDSSATEGLGYVRYRQGRRDEARALLEKVLEKHPDNRDARTIVDKLKTP